MERPDLEKDNCENNIFRTEGKKAKSKDLALTAEWQQTSFRKTLVFPNSLRRGEKTNTKINAVALTKISKFSFFIFLKVLAGEECSVFIKHKKSYELELTRIQFFHTAYRKCFSRNVYVIKKYSKKVNGKFQCWVDKWSMYEFLKSFL